MTDATLVPGDTNPLAKKIRDALGVGDFDEVGVILSQFERTDGKIITYIPITIKEYDALKTAPDDILKDIGMGRWGDELWLFPAEWYDHIPEGFEVVSILDKAEKFQKGKTDDDRRFGCLAYGIQKAKQQHPSSPRTRPGKSRGRGKLLKENDYGMAKLSNDYMPSLQ